MGHGPWAFGPEANRPGWKLHGDFGMSWTGPSQTGNPMAHGPWPMGHGHGDLGLNQTGAGHMYIYIYIYIYYVYIHIVHTLPVFDTKLWLPCKKDID